MQKKCTERNKNKEEASRQGLKDFFFPLLYSVNTPPAMHILPLVYLTLYTGVLRVL